jgi:hypothetical protein
MKMETKFLRLHTPVELCSRFGDWSVCWLGGWQKHRMYYLVMLVKLEPRDFPSAVRISTQATPTNQGYTKSAAGHNGSAALCAVDHYLER